jgi:3,4-dihydroxy 2-butanone 4-phosphate synthase/GTP cyclohydrolase II
VIVLLHRPETAADLLERARGDEDSRAASGVVLRNYGIGAQILRDLGVRRMRILGVPRPMPSMAGFDLEVTGYLHPKDS